VWRHSPQHEEREMTDPIETPHTPPPPPDSPLPPGGPSQEERQWAMFAHLSALLGGLLTSALGGWGTFIGPLVIWLVKKDTMAFVDDQGKEALNFNITVAIALLALVILSIITFGIGLLLAVPLMVIIGIGWLVLTIIASIKANEGVAYRYPIALRLIK
jgi:uncharacterized protein